jgi:ADP-ribose pyrophosphatase YjhB (NUDIX family)
MITCTFEDGGAAQLRHVSANAIIVKDGKILLGKRGTYMGGKPMLEGGKWGLIGGYMSRDETIEQALIREAQEEVGCQISNLKLLHIKDNPDRPGEDRQNIEFVFVAEAQSEAVQKDEEVPSLEWFSIDNLPPREQIAFDHADDLELYDKYLKNHMALPIIGKFKMG